MLAKLQTREDAMQCLPYGGLVDGLGSTDVKLESAVADSLLVASARPRIAALVEELHRAREPSDYYRLQRNLLRQTYANQLVADETRGNLYLAKSALRGLTAQDPKPVLRIKQQQRVVADLELALRCLKAIAHAWRCVGDGMAWRALRYDRAAISVLGSGKRVGRLADRIGLDAELEAITERWWQRGSFAIHNDLTNCLRTGDLTCPFEPGNSVTIQEVKAGNAVRSSQTDAAERRISMLRDRHGVWSTGERAQVQRYSVPMRTGLLELRQLLAAARVDGYAASRIHTGLVVVAVDPRVSLGEPGIDVMSQLESARAGCFDDPRVSQTVTMVRRIRERRVQFPYLAPLTIYPLPPIDIAELLLGPLEYVSTLHHPSIEREFAAVGIRAAIPLRERGVGDRFLRAERGDALVDLPALVAEQMLTELLIPSCLVAAVEAMLDTIDGGGAAGNTVVAPDEHRSVWS
jgi:hypothetical protein